MATQATFVPFSESRTPEQRSQWVEEQRALGNPKILPKRDWYKKNEVNIRISNLEKKVDDLTALIRASNQKLVK